jgi:hypothetical protein
VFATSRLHASRPALQADQSNPQSVEGCEH